MKEKGIALGFSKDNTTADEIYTILHEVITNPKYKQNAMKLSQLMRDVNETPLEKVINLIGYLIRHKGAEHLKLSSRHLNVFQYFCLDTISFLLLCFSIIAYCQYQLVKYIWKNYIWSKVQNIIAQIMKSESMQRSQQQLIHDSRIKPAAVDISHNNNNNNYSDDTGDCSKLLGNPITDRVRETSPPSLKKIL